MYDVIVYENQRIEYDILIVKSILQLRSEQKESGRFMIFDYEAAAFFLFLYCYFTSEMVKSR